MPNVHLAHLKYSSIFIKITIPRHSEPYDYILRREVYTIRTFL